MRLDGISIAMIFIFVVFVSVFSLSSQKSNASFVVGGQFKGNSYVGNGLSHSFFGLNVFLAPVMGGTFSI